MKHLGHCTLSILLAFYKVFVLYKGYNWFLVPLNLPIMSYLSFFGIVTSLQLFKYKYNGEKPDDDQFVNICLEDFLFSSVYGVILYFVHLAN